MTSTLPTYSRNFVPEVHISPVEKTSRKKQDDYLSAILEGNEQGILAIYKDMMPLVCAIVRKYRGSSEDAADVFQDALIIVVQKVKEDECEIKTHFKGYFIGVCKYIWMNKSRRSHRQDISMDQPQFHREIEDEHDIEEMLNQQDMQRLFREKFALLEPWQQQLLELSFAGKTHREIAKIMSFSSEGYTKKKKFLAKKRLIELIEADARYGELVI